jgi:anti-sigma factor RsiW/cytoskeletal protein CcmA (bactofilin family)
MSCAHEWWIAAYVDGGIEPAEVRRLEAHLVGCERCRARVLALREEARALGALLRDDTPPPAANHAPAPARGMAYGLPVAVGVTALATAVGSALMDTTFSSGLGWLRPSALLGVNGMLFDTIFMLRDRAPGWLELAAALGALAGLAAVFTFLAGALLRRYAGGLVAGLAAGLALAAGEPAQAVPRFAHEDTVRIERGESHDGTLVVSCESLEIDGIVVGDVIAFCERIAVRGEVEGSLVVMTRELELRGRVADSVIAAAHQAVLEGSVGASAYVGAERLVLRPGGRVTRDAFLGGERVRVEGEVGRDLTMLGERLEVEGEVGRDVEARAERIAVLPGARIGRDLAAHLPDQEHLEVAQGAVIAGTSDVEVLEGHRHTLWSRYRDGRFYTWLAVGFVASFLIGLILHAVAPSWFAGRIETGREFFGSLGVGVAFAVLGPLACIVLALTVVGIPAALLGLAVWGACLYLGAVVVAALIGRSLVRSRGDSLREFGMALAVGLAVVVLLRNVPVVGAAAGWVIALVGVGLLVTQAHAAWRRSRRAAVAPSA